MPFYYALGTGMRLCTHGPADRAVESNKDRTTAEDDTAASEVQSDVQAQQCGWLPLPENAFAGLKGVQFLGIDMPFYLVNTETPELSQTHLKADLRKPGTTTTLPLALEISLSERSFLSVLSRKDNVPWDLCINVFYNGEFCSSKILSHRTLASSGVHQKTIHFDGKRAFGRGEAVWALDRASGDGQGIPGTYCASARWELLSKMLRDEAEAWGTDEQGHRCPTREFLDKLAQISIPEEVIHRANSGKKGIGIGCLDVLITFGVSGRRRLPDMSISYPPLIRMKLCNSDRYASSTDLIWKQSSASPCPASCAKKDTHPRQPANVPQKHYRGKDIKSCSDSEYHPRNTARDYSAEESPPPALSTRSHSKRSGFPEIVTSPLQRVTHARKDAEHSTRGTTTAQHRRQSLSTTPGQLGTPLGQRNSTPSRKSRSKRSRPKYAMYANRPQNLRRKDGEGNWETPTMDGGWVVETRTKTGRDASVETDLADQPDIQQHGQPVSEDRSVRLGELQSAGAKVKTPERQAVASDQPEAVVSTREVIDLTADSDPSGDDDDVQVVAKPTRRYRRKPSYNFSRERRSTTVEAYRANARPPRKSCTTSCVHPQPSETAVQQREEESPIDEDDEVMLIDTNVSGVSTANETDPRQKHGVFDDELPEHTDGTTDRAGRGAASRTKSRIATPILNTGNSRPRRNCGNLAGTYNLKDLSEASLHAPEKFRAETESPSSTQNAFGHGPLNTTMSGAAGSMTLSETSGQAQASRSVGGTHAHPIGVEQQHWPLPVMCQGSILTYTTRERADNARGGTVRMADRKPARPEAEGLFKAEGVLMGVRFVL
jgi:hypothetical protein